MKAIERVSVGYQYDIDDGVAVVVDICDRQNVYINEYGVDEQLMSECKLINVYDIETEIHRFRGDWVKVQIDDEMEVNRYGYGWDEESEELEEFEVQEVIDEGECEDTGVRWRIARGADGGFGRLEWLRDNVWELVSVSEKASDLYWE